MSERTQAGIEVARDRCPYCHADVAPDQPKAACDSCMAWHHAECWEEYGACAACAAAEVAGHELAKDHRGLPCAWKGWSGLKPVCEAVGHPREGIQAAYCAEHFVEFEQGRRYVAPIVLSVIGVACLLGSGTFVFRILGLRPIPGMYVAAAAVLGSLGLWMTWLAWSRWPAAREAPGGKGPAERAAGKAPEKSEEGVS